MSDEQEQQPEPETDEQKAFRCGGTQALRAYRREQADVLQEGEPTWRELCNFDEDEGS